MNTILSRKTFANCKCSIIPGKIDKVATLLFSLSVDTKLPLSLPLYPIFLFIPHSQCLLDSPYLYLSSDSDISWPLALALRVHGQPCWFHLPPSPPICPQTNPLHPLQTLNPPRPAENTLNNLLLILVGLDALYNDNQSSYIPNNSQVLQ